MEADRPTAETHRHYVERVPGFAVVGTAASGTQARRLLARAPADLLLLDLHLPDGHGLALLRSLRAEGHRADAIAVTRDRDLAVVRDCASLGVLQYVLKPFPFATLRDRLVRYAEFRGACGEAEGQEDVDRALAVLRVPGPAALPKGLTGATLAAVTGALRRAGEGGLSATETGVAVGVSRITARRYLEHLVLTDRAARSPRYQDRGRPEMTYRWLRERRALPRPGGVGVAPSGAAGHAAR
ncbi:response regulator [Streptomyces boetiae]|uniref:response regulator n=1 Tax=Streptomyces boetiae TaxID=3075541 RepID=UPI00374E097C